MILDLIPHPFNQGFTRSINTDEVALSSDPAVGQIKLIVPVKTFDNGVEVEGLREIETLIALNEGEPMVNPATGLLVFAKNLPAETLRVWNPVTRKYDVVTTEGNVVAPEDCPDNPLWGDPSLVSEYAFYKNIIDNNLVAVPTLIENSILALDDYNRFDFATKGLVGSNVVSLEEQYLSTVFHSQFIRMAAANGEVKSVSKDNSLVYTSYRPDAYLGVELRLEGAKVKWLKY